jgi:hypothetical protein
MRRFYTRTEQPNIALEPSALARRLSAVAQRARSPD